MSGLSLFSAHDGSTRRSPSGGAGRSFSHGTAPLRHAVSCAVLLAALTPLPAFAQQTEVPVKTEAQDKSDLVVTGTRPAPCGGTGAIDYACLNAQLETAVKDARPASSAAAAVTADATTPSKAGTFSFSATAQRMGKNLGHSAQPYRPSAPTYATPIRGAAR